MKRRRQGRPPAGAPTGEVPLDPAGGAAKMPVPPPDRSRVLLRLAGVCLFLTAATAAAQAWQTFSHDLGSGAATCPVDDPDSGEFFCFAIACLPGDPTPHIRIGVSGDPTEGELAPLQVHVDGRPVGRLFLRRAAAEGMQDYRIPVDPARDTELIEALRVGNRATLVFGIGIHAVVETMSLSGSQSAIEQVAGLCGSPPLTPAAEDD